MKPNVANRILIAALAAAGVAGTSAFAASGSWTNSTTGTYAYSTTTNFTPAAVVNGASSILTITNGAGVISATQDVAGLTLGGITKSVSTAGAFTLSGSNSLTVDNGGAGATATFASNNAGTNANMIDVDLVLTSNLTMQANANASSVWNLGASVGGHSITGAGNLTFVSTVGASSTVNMNINTTGGIFSSQTGGTVTLAGTIGSGVTGLTLSGGTLKVSGIAPASGTALTMSAGSTLTLDNTTNTSNDRVTGNLVLGASGGFNLVGNGATSSITETVGTLNVGPGNAVVTLSNTGAGQLLSLVSTGFARSGNGTALIRGTSLNTAATNATRVTIDGINGTGLDFVGTATSSVGVGSTTDKTQRMVPYLVGDTSATGNGSSFLTYDTAVAGGLRPLASGEYTTLAIGYTTAATPENVNAFNGTITTGSSVTVNSLRFNAATLALNGSGGALEVNSGAILANNNNSSIGSGFAGLTLGNGTWNEGVITATSGNTLTISTPVNVTGSGGLIKSGAGTLVLAGGTNPYTGPTSVHQGTLSISSGTSIAASSGTTIRSGTTLSNTGTVGAVTDSGTFTNNVGGAAGAVTVNTGGTATNNGTITGTVTLGLSTTTTAINFTNNGTVSTNLVVPAGSGPIVSQANAVISGNASLGGGSSTSSGGNIEVDGQLTIGGSTAVTLGTMTSANTTNQGTGAIYYNNTNVSGNSLDFANGTSLSFFAPGNGSIGTLNTAGTAYIGIYGQMDNVPFDITFGSGTWNIGQVGQNNTGKQTGGTTNIRGGAIVNLSTAGAWPSGNNLGPGYMHGIYNVGGASSGTFNITGNVSESNGRTATPPAGATNGLQITVENGGILTVSGTTAIAIVNAQTTGQSNSITVNTGGAATLTGAVTLGGNANNGASIDTNTLAVTGGTLTVPNAVNVGGATGTAATGSSNNFNISGGSASVVNLPLGSANNAASNTVANTVNLSGGRLLVSGSTGITAGAGSNQTNTFNWTAGRLSALKITPSAKFTTPGSGGVTATGLVNSGGTFAPGDVGTAGNTTIAGDYTQQAGGTLAIDIAGTNQTGAFQNVATPSYDNILLSGATASLSLAGNLQVSLVGFTPATGSTFTIIRATALSPTITGAFANVAFGSRITTQGGEGSFLVSNTGTTITLSNYQSALTNNYASWIGGFSVGALTLPNDDYDEDGLDNAVEHILGSSPAVANTGLTQVSSGANSVTFRHNQTNSLATDVTKSYQWSTDLVEWKSSGETNLGGITGTITETTTTDNVAPANDVIEVTVTATGGTAAKLFGRLVATKAP